MEAKADISNDTHKDWLQAVFCAVNAIDPNLLNRAIKEVEEND